MKIPIQRSVYFDMLQCMVNAIDYSKLIDAKYYNSESVEVMQYEFYTKISFDVLDMVSEDELKIKLRTSAIFEYLIEINERLYIDYIQKVRKDIRTAFILAGIRNTDRVEVIYCDEFLMFKKFEQEEFTEIL